MILPSGGDALRAQVIPLCDRDAARRESACARRAAIKSIDRKCHISAGDSGEPNAMLCGTKHRVGICQGGISVATCLVCLRCALLQDSPLDYLPGVFTRAVERARKLGVKV